MVIPVRIRASAFKARARDDLAMPEPNVAPLECGSPPLLNSNRVLLLSRGYSCTLWPTCLWHHNGTLKIPDSFGSSCQNGMLSLCMNSTEIQQTVRSSGFYASFALYSRGSSSSRLGASCWFLNRCFAARTMRQDGNVALSRDTKVSESASTVQT